MDYMMEHYIRKAKDSWEKFKSDQRGLQDAVNIVLSLVMIVVVGAIGIFVADKTVTATGTPANTNLSTMQTSLLSAGQTGASFIVILVIAFIGGIAIAYMFGMMGKKGK